VFPRPAQPTWITGATGLLVNFGSVPKARIERLVACLGPCASFVKFVVYRTFSPRRRMRDDVDFRQQDVCER
jgi:hypothetical protein